MKVEIKSQLLQKKGCRKLQTLAAKLFLLKYIFFKLKNCLKLLTKFKKIKTSNLTFQYFVKHHLKAQSCKIRKIQT